MTPSGEVVEEGVPKNATAGQLPLVYNHKPTGRGDDYVDLTGRPLFPVAFGLSYTSFAYEGLEAEPADVAGGGPAVVRCTMRNAGDDVI